MAVDALPVRPRVTSTAAPRSTVTNPGGAPPPTTASTDRKSTRLNSSHTEIYTLSLHDALPIYGSRRAARSPARHVDCGAAIDGDQPRRRAAADHGVDRSEEHTSELQSHRDLHSFPTRRSSDLWQSTRCPFARASRRLRRRDRR